MISKWRPHSRKALVCDGIRPSGMDLYYTGLPDTLETHFLIFFLLLAYYSLFGGATCVVPVWNGGLTESTASKFIIYTVFLIKKKKCKKKKKKKSSVASVALYGSPEADHCEQRFEYRTRNSEASCSIPSLASDCE